MAEARAKEEAEEAERLRKVRPSPFYPPPRNPRLRSPFAPSPPRLSVSQEARDRRLAEGVARRKRLRAHLLEVQMQRKQAAEEAADRAAAAAAEQEALAALAAEKARQKVQAKRRAERRQLALERALKRTSSRGDDRCGESREQITARGLCRGFFAAPPARPHSPSFLPLCPARCCHIPRSPASAAVTMPIML